MDALFALLHDEPERSAPDQCIIMKPPSEHTASSELWLHGFKVTPKHGDAAVDMVAKIQACTPSWCAVLQREPTHATLFALGERHSTFNADTHDFYVCRLDDSLFSRSVKMNDAPTLLQPGTYKLSSPWDVPIALATLDLNLQDVQPQSDGTVVVTVTPENAESITRYFVHRNTYIELEHTPAVAVTRIPQLFASTAIKMDSQVPKDEPVMTNKHQPGSVCPRCSEPLKCFANGLMQCKCLMEGNPFHVCPRSPDDMHCFEKDGVKYRASFEEDGTHELTEDPIRCAYCDGSAWCAWCSKLAMPGEMGVHVCMNKKCTKNRQPYHICPKGNEVAPNGATYVFSAAGRAFCPRCAVFNVSSLTRRAGI